MIEGPELSQDYSYFLINQLEDLKDYEKGILIEKLKEDVA